MAPLDTDIDDSEHLVREPLVSLFFDSVTETSSIEVEEDQ